MNKSLVAAVLPVMALPLLVLNGPTLAQSALAQPAQVAPATASASVIASATGPALLHTAPIRASYAAYVAGMRVLELDAEFVLQPARYELVTTFRTAGMLATFIDGEQTSRVVGQALVAPSGPRGPAVLRPDRYTMEGVWRGNTRRITLEYENGLPRVRALVPPNDAEREAVPEALQRNTVDTLTALAALTRTVAETGSCEGTAQTFDGRRRTDFSARTEGSQVLARNSRGIFAGEALACRFEGRQVAGFYTNRDRDEAARPREGRAWMARLIADAPPIPVRLEADSGFLGTVSIYLTKVEPGAPRTVLGRQTAR
jgi:hypothetical protein